MRSTPITKRFTLITGHYGCGKTNLSINLALQEAALGKKVTLVDLDIVNPYFRSSDYTSLLTDFDIKVIAPAFAGTTLENPSLPAELYSVFEGERTVILDIGGDDAGATALGRFNKEIQAIDYDLLYVINMYRNLTQAAMEAVQVLHEIQAASRLKATGIVNNSHLQNFTTVETVLDSIDFAKETAKLLNLPLVCTTIPYALSDEFSAIQNLAIPRENLYPVKQYVSKPWETIPR